ncbi:MAG: disulfide bond formation protein DsbA [Hyphomicrobiales bacterium]|nr:MAG: disulfide bond formation protein DsbA [Hyphomicrobiales bacterium]
MAEPQDVILFFNFRSPYCYLASKTLWRIFDDYEARLVWRPFGGWTGRSDPERFKIKVKAVRQDVRRFAKKLGIAFNPPPVTTDPTRAGAGSLLAEKKGLLRPYIMEVMHAEWAEGQDIGETDVLKAVAVKIGLDPDELAAVVDDPAYLAILDEHSAQAKEANVFGVPSFLIGEEIFWGNDRVDFVCDALEELGLKKA